MRPSRLPLMRRLLPRSPVSKILIATQLGCVAAGSTVLFAVRAELPSRALPLIVSSIGAG